MVKCQWKHRVNVDKLIGWKCGVCPVLTKSQDKSTDPNSSSVKDRKGSKPRFKPDPGKQDRKQKGKKHKANLVDSADESTKQRPKKKAKVSPQQKATPKPKAMPKMQGNRNRGGSNKGGKRKRKQN